MSTQAVVSLETFDAVMDAMARQSVAGRSDGRREGAEAALLAAVKIAIKHNAPHVAAAIQRIKVGDLLAASAVDPEAP